jgi:hypothetical protein
VQRFEQTDEKSLALRAQPGLDFNGMSAHR